ncbi:hypothetical protein CC86DRAFT_174262 [Ophiobolus disseminans]|uniref:Uncharacterized protein n=1 Tax=Ophiobolus disseminans TaxID=1469910 RepID=A0A6A7AAI1_9PLEO|nr:hypothetical protein CC86DRAFT_174262 [Ophiobolus disseminans]
MRRLHLVPLRPRFCTKSTRSTCTMCQLQETTYACGHRRKTLFRACDFAQRLAPMPDTRAPSFCLNGLEITREGVSDESCGIGHSNHSAWSELDDFYDCEAAVHSEFECYMRRIRWIETCLDGERPECNWAQIAREGFDVDRLKQQQETTWSQTLPEHLAYVESLLIDISNELQVAGTHTVDALLGYADPNALPELQITLDPDWYPDPSTESPALQIYAQVHHVLRSTVRSNLIRLEELAIVACLDGVGWSLPDDDSEAVERLMACIESRVARPLVGGIQVRQDRWIECWVRTHTGRLDGVEWYDRLDVAE